MPLSRTLWDEIVPPAVWITISSVEPVEADHVLLTVRLKEVGQRSISCSVPVTRYAPTATIVLAISKAIESMAFAQKSVDAKMLKTQVMIAVETWVDPF
jgi:hypothetical protein